MLLGVEGDLERDGLHRCRGCPIPRGVSPARVEDDPRRIVRAVVGLTLDLVGAEALLAPLAKLRQREAVAQTPADVDDPLDDVARRLHLFRQEREQIAGMKIVPYLVPGPPEADVSQGLPVTIGVNPKGEDALVGLPELPRAGEHTTSIDEDGQIEGAPVLEGERLGREFRRP